MKAWIIALFIASQAFALSPVSPSYSGQIKDIRFVASPSRSGAVPWNPETSEAPLSTHAAVKAARAALRKFLPPAEPHFTCDDIAIHGQGASRYYVVRFQSTHPSLIKELEGGVGFYPAILPFIVHTDGSVELPTVRED